MLSTRQLLQFEEEGYLLLSGLIPQEIVTKAEAAMWQMMGMEAEKNYVSNQMKSLIRDF